MDAASDSQSEPDDRIAVLDIRHLLLLRLEEGLTIFYQPFTAKAIEPQLFGALISAMSAFYADGSSPVGQRIPQDLEVRGYRSSASYGKFVTGVFLHHGSIPERVVAGLERFISMFESEYGLVMRNWDGDARLFNITDLRKGLFESLNCTDMMPHEFTYRAMLSLWKEPYGPILGEIRRYSAGRGQFFFGDAIRRLSLLGNYSESRIHLLLSEMRDRGLISPIR